MSICDSVLLLHMVSQCTSELPAVMESYQHVLIWQHCMYKYIHSLSMFDGI